ncbi:MAG: hypothetical protein SNH16_08115, partial [Rikenellaceae bacterium]
LYFPIGRVVVFNVLDTVFPKTNLKHFAQKTKNIGKYLLVYFSKSPLYALRGRKLQNDKS